MTERNDSEPSSARDDPLAELIRAAGRRPDPPQAHYDGVYAAAHAAWQAKLNSRRRVRVAYALAASIAAAICVVGLLQLLPSGQPGETSVATARIVQGEVLARSPSADTWHRLTGTDVSIAPGERLRTEEDSRAAFELASGVSLRLNEATELVLEDTSTIMLLAGTAYIDTGNDSARSVVQVETPLGVVRDIGTQFEVRSTEFALRLRVRTGSVELTRPDDSSEQATAAEELELSTAGAVRRSFLRPDDPEWQWVQELAVAPQGGGRSILSYLQWIASETGRELRFDTINTEFRAETETWNHDLTGMSPTEVLELIEQGSDFDYQLLSDGAILMSRK